ncbi:hypothetical protein ACP5F4_005219 [Klebsiella oxytoca]|nr:hypothetical protein [Klebsiella oxytoca]
MNIETVNELIQSLESAGELSIKERKYLDVMRWAIRVAGERDAALNAERVWEKTMMEACGEDGPASVANEICSLRALRDTAIQALKSQVEQLAAENVGLKAFGDKLNEMHNALNGEGTGIQGRAEVACQQVALEAAMEEFDAIETPATDRIVAEAEARGVEKFSAHLRANYSGASVCKIIALGADDFAKQLREGADK